MVWGVSEWCGGVKKAGHVRPSSAAESFKTAGAVLAEKDYLFSHLMCFFFLITQGYVFTAKKESALKSEYNS